MATGYLNIKVIEYVTGKPIANANIIIQHKNQMPINETTNDKGSTRKIPDSKAKVVLVNYKDYIKNVVSSEIFPTWPDEAIRANAYAIQSIALNRIYTEWYRQRGYNFQITSSTSYDMNRTLGRN